jgi:hypothetical protein
VRRLEIAALLFLVVSGLGASASVVIFALMSAAQ